ncbi:hypothetical protein FACS189452_10550 [Bacteroidia bacterium]|nr:hypothetical protein FACS189452_10550 [Bacteroidia bacterium]GHT80213.1 hypothetical protein FACS189467_1820 [Bacteroidia bacterium]
MQYFSPLKSFPNGGLIEIIDGYIKKSDHDDLIAIAHFFAQQGKIVQIPTDIHFKNELYRHIFGKLMGTIYERRCPDLIIDGEFYEYESYVPPFKKEKIFHMISKGLQQSSRIIINNDSGADDNFILQNIHNRVFYEKQNVEEVWLFEKGKIRLFFKKQ